MIEFIAGALTGAITVLVVISYAVVNWEKDNPRLVSYAEDMSTCTLTVGDSEGTGYFYDRVYPVDDSQDPVALFESIIGKDPQAFLREPVYQVTESEVREFARSLVP